MTPKDIENLLQKFITESDLLVVGGKVFVSNAAIKKIEDYYSVTFDKNTPKPYSKVKNAIVKLEGMRLEKDNQVEERKKIVTLQEHVLDYLEKVVSSEEKINYTALAIKLMEKFPMYGQGVMESALITAAANKLVGYELLDSYRNQVAIQRFEKFVLEAKKENNEDEIVNLVSQKMIDDYKKGINHGLQRVVINYGIPEYKEAIMDKFYELLAPIIVAKYKDTKLRGKLLASDLLKNYEAFNMGKIFQILESANLDFDIEYARRKAFEIEDKHSVELFLINASKRGLKASEIVAGLREEGYEYPESYLVDVAKELRRKGLVIPIKGIIAGFEQKEISKETKEDFELSEKEKKPAVLSENQDEFYELESLEQNLDGQVGKIVEDVEEKKEQKPRKFHILKREKTKTSSEKKKFIPDILVSAGIISTAALVTVFGVNPAVAAKNAAASMQVFAKSGIHFGSALATHADMIGLFTATSATLLGTIQWLKYRKLNRELENEEGAKRR